MMTDAKSFMLAADTNNDGALTFAEFAWQLAKQMETVGESVNESTQT